MERWLPAQSLRSKPQWLLKRRGDAECVGIGWVWHCAQVEHKWRQNKWLVRGWLGVWECLPHTREALSLNPRHSCKDLGTAICAWKLSTGEGGDKDCWLSAYLHIQWEILSQWGTTKGDSGGHPMSASIIGVHCDVPHYVHTQACVLTYAPLPHIQMLKAEQTEFLVFWELVLSLSH